VARKGGAKGGDPGQKIVASNRKARHDYAIDEVIEAGIKLTGDEVKSLRGGRASLTEAYARVRDGEVWLEGMHVPPYEQGDARRHLPMRPRKLLMHRREIDRLGARQAEERLVLIPLRVYFTHGIAKVELGLGRGKREFEKRQSIAKRESQREIERELGRRR
jgi:SsrA-binding protein